MSRPRQQESNPLTESDSLHRWILDTLPHALAYAMSLLRDRDRAEDVVHDCYCRLLQKAAVYDLPRDGLKILLRAITNAAIDLQGRQRMLSSLDSADSEEVADHRVAEPLATAMTRELEQALGTALADLPLAQRAALEMKSLGHSLQEIADDLAITVSHAGVLIHRARQTLAKVLAPHLKEDAIS